MSLLGTATAASAQTTTPRPFTAGNYVVLQVGTAGSGTALSSTATPVYLAQYTPTDTLVQTVAVPATDASLNYGLTLSGSATSEGLLSRSADGCYLLLAGYNAAPSTTALPAAVATAGPNMAFRGVALAPLATALPTCAEATQQELALYPTPTHDVLTVRLADGSAAGHTVQVRDLLGRPVLGTILPASG